MRLTIGLLKFFNQPQKNIFLAVGLMCLYSPVRLVAAGFGVSGSVSVSGSGSVSVSGSGSVNENIYYADAAAYYIATAGFIGVSRRTRRSNVASDAASCINKTNKQNVDAAAAAGTCGNQTNSPYK
ncbi:hypothetical protein YC2023_064114 [Brassica napus]